MSILDNLPHVCRRLRRTRTLDALGGAYDSFEVVGDDLACWQQGAGDREIVEFAKRGISVTNKVYFTSNPHVDESYVLQIDGYWYEVRSEARPDASVGLSVVWRVMCERTSVGTTNVPWSANPDDVVDDRIHSDESSSFSSSSSSSSVSSSSSGSSASV